MCRLESELNRLCEQRKFMFKSYWIVEHHSIKIPEQFYGKLAKIENLRAQEKVANVRNLPKSSTSTNYPTTADE